MPQINYGLSENEARRYRELMDKRRAVMLTPAEHQALLRPQPLPRYLRL